MDSRSGGLQSRRQWVLCYDPDRHSSCVDEVDMIDFSGIFWFAVGAWGAVGLICLAVGAPPHKLHLYRKQRDD